MTDDICLLPGEDPQVRIEEVCCCCYCVVVIVVVDVVVVIVVVVVVVDVIKAPANSRRIFTGVDILADVDGYNNNNNKQ